MNIHAGVPDMANVIKLEIGKFTHVPERSFLTDIKKKGNDLLGSSVSVSKGKGFIYGYSSRW